jgi:hypothetical protein
MLPLTYTARLVADATAHRQEAVMGQAIPQQHPAVVLRSRFTHLRALLAIAMVAIVGLSTAVVILANDSDGGSDTSAVAPSGSIRYGGFNPATGRPDAASLPEQGARSQPGSTRYDGGPEEGTRGIVPPAESSPRYDGGPEEGTRGLGSNPN